ncbi:SpoIIE family protein phosphatase [Streptomyces sp. NPDC012474]|uniref:SpoIIE family protein phosphatase n=1 Tax=Streptomyces sp. NPDC012474 TaxID=3364836 RepID=UPI0036E8CA93
MARVSATPRAGEASVRPAGGVSAGGRWPGGEPPFGAVACGGLTGHAVVPGALPDGPGGRVTAGRARGTEPGLRAAPGHDLPDVGTPEGLPAPVAATTHGPADTGVPDTATPGTHTPPRSAARATPGTTAPGEQAGPSTAPAHGPADTGAPDTDTPPPGPAAHATTGATPSGDQAGPSTAAPARDLTGGAGTSGHQTGDQAPPAHDAAGGGSTGRRTQRGEPDDHAARAPGLPAPGAASEIHSAPVAGVRAGGVNIPYGGDEYSGDAWGWVRAGDRVTLLLADGLGHGPEAARASSAAVTALHRWAHLSPAESLRRLHEALRGTRGAAVALAQLDLPAGRLRFAGIGNVGARLRTGGAWRALLSRPGIVGVHRPATLREEEADWTGDPLLILHTDGLPSRWTPPSGPGSAPADPAVTAAVTIRDASSPALPVRDDTAVAVLTSTPPEHP